MSQENKKSARIGLGSLIFIIFLVLKLAKIGDVANWSWWWVVSPLWIPIALILIISIFTFLTVLLVNVFNK